MGSNSRMFVFDLPNKNLWSNIGVFTYNPILKGLFILLSIFVSIYILNSSIENILSYSLALAAPLITVTLIHLKESYSSFQYEKRLKSALINEIIFNLDSLKGNENILKKEYASLKNGAITTDPLAKMVWDVWEMIRFHYASKSPSFDLNVIYEYIRGLYLINEAIDDRRLYTTIHISSRIEFNKVILGLSSLSLPEIKSSLETLNVRMFTFEGNITIDEVATTLNKNRIPIPIGIKPLFERPLEDLIVIVNQN